MNPAGSWKPSLFNTFLYQQGRYYCFNSRSSALFSLEPREYHMLAECLRELEQGGNNYRPGIYDLLAQNSFIVPSHIDEYEQEHQLFLKSKADMAWAFLALVPTLACNLRCSYCFQRQTPWPEPMNEKIQERVLAVFSELAPKVRGIAVHWFGGEPLLALKTIETLSEKFHQTASGQGIRYVAEMTTNGALLNPATLERLQKLHLVKMEMSLDGLPESYSLRKGLPLAKAREFYQFLYKSAEPLLHAVRKLIIRINVDRENVHEAQEFVLRMKQECPVAARIGFRIQILSTGKGLIECIPHKCYAADEVSGIEMDFKKFLAAEGLRVYGLPQRLDHPCMAVRKYAFTFDPAGNTGKCVPATGLTTSSFFSLNSPASGSILEELAASAQPYAAFDPFESDICRHCHFLPICLGQCPRDHEEGAFTCNRKVKFEAELPFYDQVDPSLLQVNFR
jgi:uncharacterized protein